ncbi:MAG: alpha/beta hydrolase [Cyclobacteriaceae bacterium]|nr:alpha/beta hydrolase [Cyclobacteriaceae bacterium]
MIKFLIKYSIFGLLVLNQFHSIAYTVPKWENINFVGDDDLGHLLDIYISSQGAGPFPIVISIAGSVWTDNNKFWAYKYGGQGEELAENGFAVVSMNHRSSYCSNFPAQIHDVKAAVRFIRGNAERFNLNERFIGIMGYSSGGHLAALMGTSGGLDKVVEGDKEISIEGQLGRVLDESSHVHAVVDWYGPTDFMTSCTDKWNGDETNRMRFLGGSLDKIKT